MGRTFVEMERMKSCRNVTVSVLIDDLDSDLDYM